MIKLTIQKIINLFGYRVSKNNNNKIKNFDTVLKKIFKSKNIKIIEENV